MTSERPPGVYGDAVPIQPVAFPVTLPKLGTPNDILSCRTVSRCCMELAKATACLNLKPSKSRDLSQPLREHHTSIKATYFQSWTEVRCCSDARRPANFGKSQMSRLWRDWIFHSHTGCPAVVKHRSRYWRKLRCTIDRVRQLQFGTASAECPWLRVAER